MENSEEFGYYAKTVADRLGVSRDTLRAWAIKLEMAKVKFERNDKKQRIYFEKDIRAFTNMKELLDLQQPMTDVVEIIAEKIKNGEFDSPKTDNTEITPSVIRDNTALTTQEQRIEQQYNQLLETFKMMTSEYAATKEKMEHIEENSMMMVSSLNELTEQLKQEREEKELYKKKFEELLQENANEVTHNIVEQMRKEQEEKQLFNQRLDKSIEENSKKTTSSMKEIMEQLKKEKEEQEMINEQLQQKLGQSIERNSEKTASSMQEIMEQLRKLREENAFLTEKNDIMFKIIQDDKEAQKKGFLKRLFGG